MVEQDIQRPPLASACMQVHTNMCMDHIHTYTQTWAKTDIFSEKGHTAKKHMGLCIARTISREMQTRRSWECIREQPASGRTQERQNPCTAGGEQWSAYKESQGGTFPLGCLDLVELQSGSPAVICMLGSQLLQFQQSKIEQPHAAGKWMNARSHSSL